MSRASKNVYHPHGDANNFQTVEETLDSLDDRVTTVEDTTVPGLQSAITTVQNNLTALDNSFDEATASEYRANTSGFKCLAPEVVWTAAGYVALTDASTIAVNMATGFNFSVTIAGDRTLGSPTNAKVGQSGCFKVTASGADRTLSRGASYKCTVDVNLIFPLIIASGTTAYIFYFVDASNRIILTAVANNPT